MTQDNAPNKPVHLIFLCGGIVLFYLVQWTIDWLWGYFAHVPAELFVTLTAGAVALTTSVMLFRNETVYTLTNEVAAELKKVTWPTAKEVKAATLVVVVMVLVSAVILGTFDAVWSKVTELIYG